jgi:hypothetical protein
VPPRLFCSASHNMHKLDPGVRNHHPHRKLDDFPKPTRSGTRTRLPCKSVAHPRGIDTQPVVPRILHLVDGEQRHMPTGLSISIPAAKQCSCYLRAPNVSAAREYDWTNQKSSVTPHLKPQDSQVGTVSFRDGIKAYPKLSQPNSDLLDVLSTRVH